MVALFETSSAQSWVVHEGFWFGQVMIGPWLSSLQRQTADLPDLPDLPAFDDRKQQDGNPGRAFRRNHGKSCVYHT
jgi:hypothetical protein